MKMIKKYLLAIMAIIISGTSVISQEIDRVVDLYDSKGMHLEIPLGSSTKEPFGQWADLKVEVDSMELMYKAIDPLYKKTRDDGSEQSNNQSLYWAIALATVKNLSEEELPNIVPLPPEGVSKDFNADLGFICLFKPKSMTTDYKHAFILGLHKAERPDFFVVLLSNDLGKLKQSLSVLVFGTMKYR